MQKRYSHRTWRIRKVSRMKWVDNGQDDHNSDVALLGPNSLSLTEARRLFCEGVWDRAVREKSDAMKRTPPSSPPLANPPALSPPPPSYDSPAPPSYGRPTRVHVQTSIADRAFESLDANHDGVIDREELTAGFGQTANNNLVPSPSSLSSTHSLATDPQRDQSQREESLQHGSRDGVVELAVIEYNNGVSHSYDREAFEPKKHGHFAGSCKFVRLKHKHGSHSLAKVSSMRDLNCYGLYSHGLYRYGLYSHGLYSYGLYCDGLYSYGLAKGQLHERPQLLWPIWSWPIQLWPPLLWPI